MTPISIFIDKCATGKRIVSIVEMDSVYRYGNKIKWPVSEIKRNVCKKDMCVIIKWQIIYVEDYSSSDVIYDWELVSVAHLRKWLPVCISMNEIFCSCRQVMLLSVRLKIFWRKLEGCSVLVFVTFKYEY